MGQPASVQPTARLDYQIFKPPHAPKSPLPKHQTKFLLHHNSSTYTLQTPSVVAAGSQHVAAQHFCPNRRTCASRSWVLPQCLYRPISLNDFVVNWRASVTIHPSPRAHFLITLIPAAPQSFLGPGRVKSSASWRPVTVVIKLWHLAAASDFNSVDSSLCVSRIDRFVERTKIGSKLSASLRA